MSEAAANILIARIEREQRWPPPFDHETISKVARFAAFRESDEQALRQIHEWPDDRPYIIDPLGERIAEAFADLLFSDDPDVTAAAEGDQTNLDRIVSASDLPSELRHGEEIASSEGEVWWRVMGYNPLLLCPQITFHSREQVIPAFLGNRLIAVAFISEFEAAEPRRGEQNPPLYRHLEIHSEGRVENRLYLGRKDRLGHSVDLGTFSETKDLEPVWEHALPGMLAGRVLNKRGRNRRHGKADFAGIEGFLLALNEAATIGVENARLVAKQRIVVPVGAIQPPRPETEDNGDGTMTIVSRPTFDAGEDVLVANELDGELGKENAGPYKVLEYSFDAEALIRWQESLAKTAASRVGLTAQFLGLSAGLEGQAETGTALRVRLMPATGAGKGRGRYWDDALPTMLMMAQLVDQLPRSNGGYGRSYSKAGEPPAVERTDPLPTDQSEETSRHAVAVGAEIESQETAIASLHPDWTDEQVQDELKRIRDDSEARRASAGFSL